MNNTTNDNNNTPSIHLLNEDESDKRYSHEVARRSAARAALHLGITSMSSDALNVMGDVLLTFLERLGLCMATSAECSSRSSAHCNVLDAIYAIESLNSSNRFMGESNGCTTTGWESLATFGYGKNWRETFTNYGYNTGSGAGEKVLRPPGGIEGGPSNANGKQSQEDDEDGDGGSNKNGWNAPYLDLVPHYPIRRNGIRWKSLATFEEEACQDFTQKEEDGDSAKERAEKDISSIPDDAYYYWGCSSTTPDNKESEENKEETKTAAEKEDTKKRKLDDDDAKEQQSPTKKVRFSSTTTTSTWQELDSTKHPQRPSYVPPFLPSYPPLYTYQPTATTVPSSISKKKKKQQLSSSTTSSSSTNVRKSLVQLYEQPSKQQQVHEEDENIPLSVPKGRITQGQQQQQVVAPLNKASGSRVPRILEGSMDTSAF